MNGQLALRLDQWFRFWLPYQFVKLNVTAGRHIYLPVNRIYKPLGMTSDILVEYEQFEAQAVVFSTDPHKFRRVWHDQVGLYLYDDSLSSKVDYFARLERLLSRSFGGSKRSKTAVTAKGM